MSDHASNAPHSPSPQLSSPLPSTDLAALAALLRDTAQALLDAHAQNPPSALSRSTHRDGETRSFYFPAAALNLERELLRKYRAENFLGLLDEVHALLVGLVKVMQSVHKDVRVRGYVISSLGNQLDHASALVVRMRTVYGKVLPVQD